MASTESLVGFVLNSSLKEFGDIYISALTILQSSMQFASVPLTGFAQGFVPIISYNFGHGDKQRVKDCFRIVLVTMFSFNLILMLFMILFPSTVASAFTSDERLIETVRFLGWHDHLRLATCLSEYVRCIGAGPNLYLHCSVA